MGKMIAWYREGVTNKEVFRLKLGVETADFDRDVKRWIREKVAKLGFDLGPEASPVVAVRLPEPKAAVMLWNVLIDAGVYTNIAIPPATPNSLSLLRVSVSAAHDDEQITQALEIFAEVGNKLGLTSRTGDAAAASRVA